MSPLALLGNVPPRTAFLEAINEALSRSPGTLEVTLLIGAGVVFVVAIGAGAWLVAHRRPRRPRVDYLTLAVDLLGLSEQDRRDLRRLARHAPQYEASAMLLSPQNLARALAGSAERDRELHKRVNQLSERLFGTGLP